MSGPRSDRPATGPGSVIPAYAHLTDASGRVVGGAGLRDDDWVLVLHGRPAASTDSAGMILAMLRHTASMLRRAGHPVSLDCSDTLRDRATEEATVVGKTLDGYLAWLEAERAERAARKATDGAAHPD